MTHKYDDLLFVPHHQSAKHPHMTMTERAAQFSPFAALTGYEGVLEESARRTETQKDLTEEVQAGINAELRLLSQKLAQAGRQKNATRVVLTYFQPDDRKEGGAYLTESVSVKRILEAEEVLLLVDGRKIPLKYIQAMESSCI